MPKYTDRGGLRFGAGTVLSQSLFGDAQKARQRSVRYGRFALEELAQTLRNAMHPNKGMGWVVAGVVALLGAAVPLAAPQNAKAEITTDGSLGGPAGPVPSSHHDGITEFRITEDLGAVIGSNLFHSFETFNLNASEVGNFTGPSAIANVLARVTGGPSDINGTIRSEYAGANLFFLNPAGILFGPNAVLDIGGSFHASTADFVRLSDGVKFNAVPSLDDALLTTAPPAAFGFLSLPEKGTIAVSGGNLRVPEGKTLSLVGDIERQFGLSFTPLIAKVHVQSGILDAPGGRINLVQVGPGAEWSIDASIAGPAARPPEELGLTADFGPEEDVYIRSGVLTVRSRARVGQAGGDVTIEVNDLSLKEGGLIDTGATAGNAGDVTVHATGTVEIIGSTDPSQSEILATVTGLGKEAGRISVTAGRIRIDDGKISASASAGNTAIGGEIVLDAEIIDLVNGATVETLNIDGKEAGQVTVTARNSIVISGAGSNINSVISGDGNAGRIFVRSPQLVIEDGGGISTGSGRGEGSAGEIVLYVDELGVRDSGFVTSSTIGIGDAGQVLVSGNSANIQGGAITTESEVGATGSAGEIRLELGALFMAEGGALSSSTRGEGPGGNIVIDSQHITVAEGSSISATTAGAGRGGNIEVSADQLELRNGGTISAASTSTALDLDANPDAGRSGEISIDVSDVFRLSNQGRVSVETTQANAGSIDVRVGNLLHLRDHSSITTSVANGEGDGGNINIDPIFVVLDGGSEIVAQAKAGRGGNITIVTDYLFKSIDSIIDASSEQGIDGTVVITSPDTDLVSSTLPLPDSFLDAAGLLGSHCAAKTSPSASSLVVSGRGGLPPGPDTFLPSYSEMMSVDHAPRASAIPTARAHGLRSEGLR